METMNTTKNSVPEPKPVRDNLQEKAPQNQKGDKFAGLQPDAQDAAASSRAPDTRDPISKANQ